MCFGFHMCVCVRVFFDFLVCCFGFLCVMCWFSGVAFVFSCVNVWFTGVVFSFSGVVF